LSALFGYRQVPQPIFDQDQAHNREMVSTPRFAVMPPQLSDARQRVSAAVAPLSLVHILTTHRISRSVNFLATFNTGRLSSKVIDD
jgi:hypothetical protein